MHMLAPVDFGAPIATGQGIKKQHGALPAGRTMLLCVCLVARCAVTGGVWG